MPPSVPTLPAGAISEGMDQHTGAAAASPPSEMLIQKIAEIGVCAWTAPKMPSPKEVPATKTVWRTREESKPRWINLFTTPPPIQKSVRAANNHGMQV